MTNAPENYDSYVLPDGVDKLEYIPDPKLASAGSFKLEREDHTMGNLLRMQIMEDERVIFVGYRQPHPLQHHIMLRVQTVKTTTPRQVLSDAIEALQKELDGFVRNVADLNPFGLIVEDPTAAGNKNKGKP